MKRRTFVALGTAGAAGVAFPYLVSSRQSVDLVLRGGTIADGSGAPLFEGDVAILKQCL